MTRSWAAGLTAVAVGPPGWCVALGTLVGGDPVLAIEIAGAALVVLWAALVGMELVRSHRLSRALDRDAFEMTRFDVRFRVTPVLRADAIVVGPIRPVIYVGPELLTALADDEVRAVLFHEDHHRRTRAPIRAAALGAWVVLLGRSHRIRTMLMERMSGLEALADASAIQRGSSPRSLAKALLKGDVTAHPVSFAYAAERRVADLLERAAGMPVRAAARFPYEWFPALLLGAVSLGCHAAL